jgi:hypothetical protein
MALACVELFNDLPAGTAIGRVHVIHSALQVLWTYLKQIKVGVLGIMVPVQLYIVECRARTEIIRTVIDIVCIIINIICITITVIVYAIACFRSAGVDGRIGIVAVSITAVTAFSIIAVTVSISALL